MKLIKSRPDDIFLLNNSFEEMQKDINNITLEKIDKTLIAAVSCTPHSNQRKKLIDAILDFRYLVSNLEMFENDIMIAEDD
jgi:hypothetical protein